MAGRMHHVAPAGRKYTSIRHAGEDILARYCNNYPQNSCRSSFILPVLFQSAHPENIEQNTAAVKEADQRGLIGLKTNIQGERGEYAVYKIFYSLVRLSLSEFILVIHGYKLDNDNSRGLKKRAIINELPNFDSSAIRMGCEHDFIVIVRYLGVVLCEVKTSASEENMKSAESQLLNSEAFVKQVMTAIGGPNSPLLPTVKIIVVPNKQVHPSPINKYNDCHVIYAELLEDFQVKWSDIVQELDDLVQMNGSINRLLFEHLVQFLVGVWTMKPMTKNTYDFDVAGASMPSKVTSIDTAVNQADFAPSKQAKRYTTDVATSLNQVFQQVDDFNILYMSPEQKMLYDNHPCALIHAHAGTGKTMLIIFKIIEILEADSTHKVLLVTPHPHTIRCQLILKKHGIRTDIVKTFPYAKPQSQSLQPQAEPLLLPIFNVLIVSVDNFFKVTPETLMSYDLSDFSIFTDDLHSYTGNWNLSTNFSTYTDIGDFIDTTYSISNASNKYAWFCFDIVQFGIKLPANERPHRLFLKSDGSTRMFAIPIITMTNVLRNTREVTDVLDSARNAQSDIIELDKSYMISKIDCGHHITTGDRVLYEKLQQNTDSKYCKPFILDRVCAFLCKLTVEGSFRLGSVAIMFFNKDELVEYKQSLEMMLRVEFNTRVQTIEESLLNYKHNDVILDHCNNAQSFESPIVVFVCAWGGKGKLYNAVSRARTKCVVIDANTTKPPFNLDHVDHSLWGVPNGKFQKL